MGICNVLAILPFICSAPADAPAEEEQEILATPAPQVEMGTLTPPPGIEVAPAPETAAAPGMRPVADYEVLPPSAPADVAYAPAGNAYDRDDDIENFSDWVSRNWGENEGE
jgi:hypothetical protein